MRARDCGGHSKSWSLLKGFVALRRCAPSLVRRAPPPVTLPGANGESCASPRRSREVARADGESERRRGPMEMAKGGARRWRWREAVRVDGDGERRCESMEMARGGRDRGDSEQYGMA